MRDEATKEHLDEVNRVSRENQAKIAELSRAQTASISDLDRRLTTKTTRLMIAAILVSAIIGLVGSLCHSHSVMLVPSGNLTETAPPYLEVRLE